MSNSEKIKQASLYVVVGLCLTAFAANKAPGAPGQKAAPFDTHANVNQSFVDAERQFQLALRDLRADNKEAAKKKLDIGIASYPDNYKMLSLRANINLMSRQFFEALSDLNKAIRLQPQEPGLLVNRSLVYRSFKNFDQAMKDLNKAVKLNPKLYSALFNRGTLHYGRARMKEASKDFKRCIELAPTDPRPRHNLALSLNGMGQRAKAIAVLEALRKNSDDRHWRGVAAKQIRDWNNPEKVQAKSEKTIPNPHAKPGNNKAK
jgi:Flp pilus assembly protein TadD